jgi:hypothetical protein
MKIAEINSSSTIKTFLLDRTVHPFAIAQLYKLSYPDGKTKDENIDHVIGAEPLFLLLATGN